MQVAALQMALREDSAPRCHGARTHGRFSPLLLRHARSPPLRLLTSFELHDFCGSGLSWSCTVKSHQPQCSKCDQFAALLSAVSRCYRRVYSWMMLEMGV